MKLFQALRNTDAAAAPLRPPVTLPVGDWHGSDHLNRIAPLDPSALKRWQRTLLTAIRMGAHDIFDYNCFLVTVRLGRAFPLHTLFFTQLLQHGAIPQADNECVVIRVAWRMGCQYEYAHHTRMAMEVGVHRDVIESLTHEDSQVWTPRIRTLLIAADELIATKNLSVPTYQALQEELDADQILQFATLVGHYAMASMMLGVAGVPIEPAFALSA